MGQDRRWELRCLEPWSSSCVQRRLTLTVRAISAPSLRVPGTHLRGAHLQEGWHYQASNSLRDQTGVGAEEVHRIRTGCGGLRGRRRPHHLLCTVFMELGTSLAS